MPLSNPFRQSITRPTLRQRAASLKSGLLRLSARPALPSPLPAPGSDEAVAAWEAARREFDRQTPLTSAEYAALRIGDSFTLWTTEWVKAARRGDFSRFSTREKETAQALTLADLDDLLVITMRRDLRTAEAARRTGIHTLYALAYPDGEDPAPEPDPEGDYAHVAIAEHREAYAAWKPLGDAWNNAVGEAFGPAEDAQRGPYLVQDDAFQTLIATTASTTAGLVALAGYLPEAVRDANCVEVEEDARHALRSLCRSVLRLFGPEADAELVMLEAEYLAADAAVRAAIEALVDGECRYVEPTMPDALKVWSKDWIYTSIPRPRVTEFLDGRASVLAYGKAEVEILRTRPCTAAFIGGKGDEGEVQPGGTRIRPDPQAQARADAIVASWDAWQAQIREARDAVGLDALEDAQDATQVARNIVLQRARETTARGLAGLAVKARIAANMAAVNDPKAYGLKHYEPDDSDGPLHDLAGDVLAVTGGLPDAFWLPG